MFLMQYLGLIRKNQLTALLIYTMAIIMLFENLNEVAVIHLQKISITKIKETNN